MFRDALKKAIKFTYPVVMSKQEVSGKCSAGLGAYVIINKEGWILTAAHIIQHIETLQNEVKANNAFDASKQSIESDATLDRKSKQKALSKLGKQDMRSAKRISVWLGLPNPATAITNILLVNGVDLAIAKLEPFDSEWVAEIPKIKRPNGDFSMGASLCKLGFPFHSFEPVYDSKTSRFSLPVSAFPLPYFPIDGIFTRTIEMLFENGEQSRFPLMYIETSTPGLKGQSGGPTIDTDGNIWAIQSQTAHYPLGFDPEVPGKPGLKEHQFMNVGWGVHAITIAAALADLGIKFELSES